jgi:hypothetical protein
METREQEIMLELVRILGSIDSNLNVISKRLEKMDVNACSAIDKLTVAIKAPPDIEVQP